MFCAGWNYLFDRGYFSFDFSTVWPFINWQIKEWSASSLRVTIYRRSRSWRYIK